MSIKLKDGYSEVLGDAPNLSNSRFAGRLMACAMNIIAKKGNDEISEQATEAIQNLLTVTFKLLMILRMKKNVI